MIKIQVWLNLSPSLGQSQIGFPSVFIQIETSEVKSVKHLCLHGHKDLKMNQKGLRK